MNFPEVTLTLANPSLLPYPFDLSSACLLRGLKSGSRALLIARLLAWDKSQEEQFQNSSSLHYALSVFQLWVRASLPYGSLNSLLLSSATRPQSSSRHFPVVEVR